MKPVMIKGFGSDPVNVPKILFIYLALTISVLLVFWQVRNFDFVGYDDSEYVYENYYVTEGLTKDSVISAFTTAPAGGNWLPLTWLSFMLDCQLFGLNPGRMHLVNVFYHLVNTLLLFAVLKKMTGSLWPSAFVAAAFALHPMHVESVAWVTERKDVLSAFFLLLTLIAYAGYVRCPSVFRYAAALVLFAMGLMAKPMLVTLPFVLLLLDYWPHNRFEGSHLIKNSSQSASAINKRSILYRLIIEKVPFIALSVVSSVITFLVQQSGGSMRDIKTFPLVSRFPNALLAYVRYIGKLFWPEDLAVLYPYEIGGIPLWQLTLCAMLLLGVTLLVLFLGRRQKYLPVGWFWFIGTLVPVIGLVQVGSQAYADRYTYIPHIGLLIMIAWGLPQLLSKWPYRRAVLGVLMVGVLTVGGLYAHRQTGYWKDGITLFSHAVKVTQNNSVMYNNLGAAYDIVGRHQEAIEAYQQAIRISPEYAEAYNNLGVVYRGLDRRQEAIEVYLRAIRIKPQYADAHYNLGLVYYSLGSYEEAAQAFGQAIRIRPNDAKAHNNLGAAYGRLGRREEEIAAYQQAIKIRPNDAKAYNNLGVAYSTLGRHQEALQAFGQAIRIQPEHADAHNNLGEAYFALGRHQEAIAAYRQAIKIKPNDAKLHNNLGIAYSNLGRYQEALEAFGQAIRIWPENADAHINLARAYHILDRYKEAIAAYQQAIKIRPERPDAHLSLGLAYVQIGDTASATKEYEILKTWNAQMADKLLSEINK